MRLLPSVDVGPRSCRSTRTSRSVISDTPRQRPSAFAQVAVGDLDQAAPRRGLPQGSGSPTDDYPERLDELSGADRTRSYIRGLLVEHGALPRRDELAVR
ncbi:MAG: hypothetical protein QOH50_2957 [Kribbellaceae bacterium]|nr:hypothetical protein [Kribbellaceae bacterium]